MVREWIWSALATGADAVLTPDIEAADTSSEELAEDSVAWRVVLGRIGERVGVVTGRDRTLVGVDPCSWNISAQAFAESTFT